MGEYIVSGLCYKLGLDISSIKEENLEEVKTEVSKLIDIEAYDCTVNEGDLIFTAKENIFMDGLVNFINQQYLLCDVESMDKNEIISMVGKISSMKEAIKIAERKQWENFQKVAGYVSITSGFNQCRGYYSIIGLFMEGKALLECYDGLFSYIEKLIKKDNQYQASRFAKVILA